MICQRIWVDTDLALAASSGDVDDGFAIAWLLAQPHVELVGISVVSGNCPAPVAYTCVLALLHQAERTDIPVLQNEAAWQALADLPADVAILAIGPLTNLAAALRLRPNLRWAQVACVGGIFQYWPRPWLRASDLNRGRDPQSWQLVMQTQQVLQCPLDVVRVLRADRRLLTALAAGRGLAPYLAKHAERWLREARWRHFALSFPLWDVVAAMALVGALEAPCVVAGRLIHFDVMAANQRLRESLFAPPASTS